MIYWLDKRLDIMGLLDEAVVQNQFEIFEGKRNVVEDMLGLIPSDEDEDPIGTVLKMGYIEALDQEQ